MIEASQLEHAGIASSGAAVGQPSTRVRRGRFRRSALPFPILSFGWVALVIISAALAGVLPLAEPDALSAELLMRPGLRWHEPLGTDDLGRSLLARLLYGARVSMVIGIGATLVAMVLGLLLGVMAGYFRRWVDTIFNIATTTVMAFPSLIFLLAVVAVLKPSLLNLTVALALLATPLFARVARASAFEISNREFVLAAKAMGGTRRRIIFSEVIPSVTLPMVSFGLTVAATLIVAEGSLSFLGLGIRPPRPSWGGMISSGRARLTTDPHLMLVPAIVFLITIVSFNRLGDWLRERLRRGAS
jgi:peptide/nickel transport system permease protein